MWKKIQKYLHVYIMDEQGTEVIEYIALIAVGVAVAIAIANIGASLKEKAEEGKGIADGIQMPR